MQTIRVIMGKIPTIIITGRPERVCRAKRPRKGHLVVGLAKLGGWKLRHARAREFDRLPLTHLTPFQNVLRNIEQRCQRAIRRIKAQH